MLVSRRMVELHVSVTEKPAALLIWMVAGPEMARVVTEVLYGLDKTKQRDSLSRRSIMYDL